MRRNPMQPWTKRFGFTGGRAETVPNPRSALDAGPGRAVRALVVEREHGACGACGMSISGRPHSVVYRVRGGTAWVPSSAADSPVNSVLLCGTELTPGSCAYACEQRDPDMHGRGFWLWTSEDPAAVPMVLAREDGSHITVWLAADGSYLHAPPNC